MHRRSFAIPGFGSNQRTNYRMIYILCFRGVGHGDYLGVLVGFGFININLEVLYVGHEGINC